MRELRAMKAHTSTVHRPSSGDIELSFMTDSNRGGQHGSLSERLHLSNRGGQLGSFSERLHRLTKSKTKDKLESKKPEAGEDAGGATMGAGVHVV